MGQPSLRRPEDGSSEELSKLEFLVQHLSRKPFITEPPGRKKSGENQFLVTVHKDKRLVYQAILDAPESVARVYLESYPTAQFLPHVEYEAYCQIQAYFTSSR